MSEFATLAALAAEDEIRSRCPLYRNTTQAAPGEGPRGARVMLIGRHFCCG